VKLIIQNQLNDGLTIEFCCGDKEYILSHNEKTTIEIEEDSCMYFDVVYK
jgi:hypothetical protein